MALSLSRPLICLLTALLLGAAIAREAPSRVVTYPAPTGEPASRDYAVTVNGQPVFCYTSYQFREDSTQRTAGRPVSPLSFASFDFSGEVEVEVRLLEGLREAGLDATRVTVRPLAHGLQPAVKDGRCRFRFSRPCQLTIEPGGSLLHPLHLFANPPERDVPRPDDPKVRYFGPGYHTLSGVEIGDGETVYVAGGAIVSLAPGDPATLTWPHQNYGVDCWGTKGLFASKWTRNVTIRGRGILCGRQALEQHQRGDLLRCQGVNNLTVEGITIRECSVWSLNLVNCDGVRVDNVKVLGHYVNNDGIVIGGTSNAVVENCFCHNADDALEIKVWIPQRNVTFRNCVVWADVGGALGLCCESGAELRQVLYQGCTVLHATGSGTARGAIGIELQGEGDVRDFRFEDIVVEDVSGERHPALKVINNWDDWHMGLPAKPDSPYEQLSPPRRDKPRGAIREVVFRNVRVLHSDTPEVVVMADGEASPIEGVTFENVEVNGTRLVPRDARLKTNQWVRGVTVR